MSTKPLDSFEAFEQSKEQDDDYEYDPGVMFVAHVAQAIRDSDTGRFPEMLEDEEYRDFAIVALEAAYNWKS